MHVSTTTNDMKTLASLVKLLGAVGMWPTDKHSLVQKAFKISFLMPSFLIFFLTLFNMCFCRGDFVCILENASQLSILLVGVHCANCELLFKDDYQNVYESLSRLNSKRFTEEQRRNLESFSSKVISVFLGLILIAGVGWSVLPLLDRPKCLQLRNASNSSRIWNTVCGTAIPAWVPKSVTDTHTGLLFTYAIETLGAYTMVFVMGGTVSLMIGECIYLFAHIKQLKKYIEEVCSGEEQLRYRKLQLCITYHIEILDFGLILRKAYNWYYATQILFLSLIFGTAGFRIILALQDSDILIVLQFASSSIAFFSETCVVCYFGEKLINESESVADCVYNIPWYEESPQFGILVQMIILRSQKPLSISSASLDVLKMESITAVIVHTYSAFNLAFQCLFS